jgi:hypothetical protein
MVYVMWSARTSARTAQVAIVASAVLAAWGVLTTVLAISGADLPPDLVRPPPVGVELAISLAALASFLVASFLAEPPHQPTPPHPAQCVAAGGGGLSGVDVHRPAPVLWALLSGVGDVIVGMTAFWWQAAWIDRAGGDSRWRSTSSVCATWW